MSTTKISFIGACILGAVALCGCSSMSSVSASRGDCEFMMPTERERCLRANATNAQALEARRDEKRRAEEPFSMPTDMKRKPADEEPEKP
jgi:hypothetical protein